MTPHELTPRTSKDAVAAPLPPGLEVYRPTALVGSTVLVVDDEAPMQAQLRLDLEDLGYRVMVASGPDPAIAILSRERISGVLLDVVLDEGEDSGFSLLSWIRRHHPSLPVVVLSGAMVSSAAIRRAYELGASSYFVKGGVQLAHIYSDLAARIIDGGTRRMGIYRFGDLEFDPTRRSISLGTRETRLTPQQTSLIVFLAGGSKPVTTEDLIAAGLFAPGAARSTVHSALLTVRRKVDELQPDLGKRFLRSTATGYTLEPVG